MSDYTVITLDGDRYVLTVPDFYTVQALNGIPDGELEMSPLFPDQYGHNSYVASAWVDGCSVLYFPTHSSEKGKAIILRHRDGRPKDEFEYQAPNNYVDFRAMLVPILPDGRFDPCLVSTANGSIVRGGNIRYKEWADDCYTKLFHVPFEKPMPFLSKETFELCDTEDTSNALEWICVDGRLVSRWVLATAQQADLFRLGLWFSNMDGILPWS